MKPEKTVSTLLLPVGRIERWEPCATKRGNVHEISPSEGLAAFPAIALQRTITDDETVEVVEEALARDENELLSQIDRLLYSDDGELVMIIESVSIEFEPRIKEEK
jgi:hypothetical protein